MKNFKLLVCTLLFLFSFSLFAQNNMEDVIYLKNGSIYRGMIIEQVPNTSYKIQIAGGSVFTVAVADITKITKEQTFGQAQDEYGDHHFMHHRDTSKAPYYLRKHYPFTELEFRPGINNAGLRLVHGFKFGRFGFVGLGVGVDAVSFTRHISDGKGIFDNTDPNNGLYVPVYVHYAGEILKKRVTPYYFLEAGFAAHPNNPFKDSHGNKSWGGPTAAAGFGVKVYAKGRKTISFNLNMNWRSNKYRTSYTTTDAFGNIYRFANNGTTHKFFGAAGIVLGF
jgi:hypothetical protein